MRVTIIIAAIAIIVFAIGCQKEYSIEQNTQANKITPQWKFSEGGTTFQGTADTATLEGTSGVLQHVMITGNSDDGNGYITLNIYAPLIIAGTYASPIQGMISYIRKADGKVLYQQQLDASTQGSFNITINKIDTTADTTGVVSGTFSGKVLDTLGNVVDISAGEFTTYIKRDPSAISVSGQVTAWASQGCMGTNPLNIIINGQSQSITNFTPTEPNCGTPGNAIFLLPPGIYPVQVVCNGDTTTLPNNISILPNGCTKLQILQ